ncbi:inorganic triphosphatase [Aquabacterium sp.]|uniref:CYTH domain-containing protein n=1 Tax=Aquabacterium sp. TaxID=1872578 RepID=UPI002489D9BE|nr:CYTH domain-containing protein [Aquabacterium sp.]MDI1351137.1 CYTH domain-containing protein [Aquabacterium sp.]
MQEIELKFQIPAEALDAVRTELARLAPDQALPAPLILQAAYFDTPDRRLAQARSALRVRREGDEWVQTLKAAGSHTMVRVEDNRATQPPPAGQPLAPSLSLHAGGPAEAALRQSLAWQPEQDADGARCGLVQLYATDMRRTRVQLAVGAGTLHEGLVELALDEGAILAGTGSAQRSVPVRELEIELISGHPQAVIDAGRDWVQRFGLWLDTQTKAHRGDRLARWAVDGDASAALPESFQPRPARLPATGLASLSAEAAWRAGVEACLAHITAHMSELAGLPDRHPGDLSAAAPVAYQWRRGLRRLRALGRFVADTQAHGTPLNLSPVAHLALQAACGHAAVLARQLGHWRDQDALAWIPRKLQQLGLPALPVPTLPVPPGCPASPVAVARSTLATELCLQVLTALLAEGAEAVAEADAAADAPSAPAPGTLQNEPPSAQAWLSAGLRRWHGHCARTARRFGDLGPRATHRLRRRARQLRDVQDLYASLSPQDEATHAQALAKALDALGTLQDETVALGRYQSVVAQDIRAQAACAWLMARRKPSRKQAQRALRRWLRCNAPW